MRVLITGGAGYVGSILSKQLLDKGYNVRILDTLWYGKESTNTLVENDRFELVKEDIRNLTGTVKAMKNVDAVIHLASLVGMPASSIEPRTSEEINYLATKNIAELCELHKIETYIFASTCSVYGSQPDKLITEKSELKPLDFYAHSKYKSERAIRWLKNAPTILRFGTLFGLSPRMRFDLVINLFIAQAIQEKSISVHGGDQYRPFLHVSEAAESLVYALEKNLTGTYNVVQENLSILEAAERIKKLTGCQVNISKDDNDKRNYKVSSDKIKQMGFIPKKNIEFGYEEIKNAIDEGKIKNFKDPRHNNYNLLSSLAEMQEEVFIQGL